MLFSDCCLLFVMCCLLFVVCLLLVGGGLLAAVCIVLFWCSLSGACCSLFVDRCWWFVACCLVLFVSLLLGLVWRFLCVLCCLFFVVRWLRCV